MTFDEQSRRRISNAVQKVERSNRNPTPARKKNWPTPTGGSEDPDTPDRNKIALSNGRDTFLAGTPFTSIHDDGHLDNFPNFSTPGFDGTNFSIREAGNPDNGYVGFAMEDFDRSNFPGSLPRINVASSGVCVAIVLLMSPNQLYASLTPNRGLVSGGHGDFRILGSKVIEGQPESYPRYAQCVVQFQRSVKTDVVYPFNGSRDHESRTGVRIIHLFEPSRNREVQGFREIGASSSVGLFRKGHVPGTPGTHYFVDAQLTGVFSPTYSSSGLVYDERTDTIFQNRLIPSIYQTPSGFLQFTAHGRRSPDDEWEQIERTSLQVNGPLLTQRSGPTPTHLGQSSVSMRLRFEWEPLFEAIRFEIGSTDSEALLPNQGNVQITRQGNLDANRATTDYLNAIGEFDYPDVPGKSPPNF